jgi:hypothetical protein
MAARVAPVLAAPVVPVVAVPVVAVPVVAVAPVAAVPLALEALVYLSYTIAALRIMMIPQINLAQLRNAYHNLLTAEDYQAVLAGAEYQFNYGRVMDRHTELMNMATIRQALAPLGFNRYAVGNFDQYGIVGCNALPVRPDSEPDCLYLPVQVNLPFSAVVQR